jgi:NAD(P)-dependent dehydrogenase (short-subunit alcohol dehydrogenase family)
MKKNIFVTGSTDGIGKLVAIKFANAGHNVYVHGRSQKKLDAVISEIKNKTNNENVNGFIADFADFSSVRNLIKEVKSNVKKLDVLINNAGVFKTSQILADNGFDLRLVVNYFSQYLLTDGLMSLFNDDARIINLSSAAQSSLSFEAFQGKHKLSISDSYAQSKLALTMLSFYLAEKNPNRNIIAVNPGSLLNTKMAKEAYGTHWSSADKGAMILYDLALDENYKTASGKYFDNDHGNFNQAHPDAYDKSIVNKLIELTKEILN